MDSLGELFGGVGEVLGGIFGEEPGVEGALRVAELLSPQARRRRGEALPAVYERYLCGKPRELDINDR